MITKCVMKIEKVSYLVLILGTMLDQISTRYALWFPHIYETNPTTVWLMTKNLWLFFDLIIVFVSILISHFLLVKFGKIAKAGLSYSLVLGALRLAVGLYNLSLLI